MNGADRYDKFTTAAVDSCFSVHLQPAAQLSPREIFGGNLRRLRRLKDLSQEDLALAADLSRVYVSEVERGLRNVSIDNMAQLADALGVELKELVDAEEDWVSARFSNGHLYLGDRATAHGRQQLEA